MTADFKSKKPALNGTTHAPPAQEEYTVYSERCAGHFYFLLLYFCAQRRLLALAISVCENMFDVSEYNGKKETKSDSEKTGQWLTKIDEDRPPSILVDSGFLPKFF